MDVAIAVADLLDVDLASDLADGVLEHPAGREQSVPAVVRALLPTVPASWTLVESLRCDGFGVEFWTVDGHVLATGGAGAAQGLAHVAGVWWARTLLERVLDPAAPAAEVAAAVAVELPGLTS